MNTNTIEGSIIPIESTDSIMNNKFLSEVEDIDEYFESKKEQGMAFILDVFEDELKTDDEIFEYTETDRFMYENESKFLLFYEKCFESNDRSCIIDFRKDSLISQLGAITGIWDNILDQCDKELFLELLFALKLNKNQMFEIRDKNIFILIVKLMYRNMSCPPDLIFIKNPMKSFYNYGCNFLLTFDEATRKEDYICLAKQSNLYMR
jgi:hypothetical protein